MTNMENVYREIINKLKLQKNPKNIEGMARFGINPKNTLGISIPFLRKLAKEICKENNKSERHILSLRLWDSEIHEARILAALVDNPEMVNKKQMDQWADTFDSWDVVDQVCMNLFDKTKYFDEKIVKWAKDEKEFVRRAAFSLIASIASHNKKLTDADFIKYFALIKKYSTDERNFVRKAVNWALRGIGKRNTKLKTKAIETAEEIINKYSNSKSAKWIAKDALRELKNK